MPTYTLPRTGAAPLRFAGDLLADVSTHNGDRGRFQRWHEIAVYQTEAGKFVLWIGYQSDFEQGRDVQTATVCDSPDAVRLALAEHDPLARFIGYSSGRQFDERQDRVKRELQLAWENAVRDLLVTAADIFAEEVA